MHPGACAGLTYEGSWSLDGEYEGEAPFGLTKRWGLGQGGVKNFQRPAFFFFSALQVQSREKNEKNIFSSFFSPNVLG